MARCGSLLLSAFADVRVSDDVIAFEGPGIEFLTRLTLLREVNWDVKTQGTESTTCSTPPTLHLCKSKGGPGRVGANRPRPVPGSVSRPAMPPSPSLPPSPLSLSVASYTSFVADVRDHDDVTGLVANPVPELVLLRSGVMASENITALPSDGAPHLIAKTGAGAAASADVVINFNISSLGASGATSATFGACVLSNGTPNSGIGIKVTVQVADAGTRWVAFAEAGACSTSGVAGGTPIPLFDENTLTLRVLPDRSVADWFVQGGRWAATTGWQTTAPRAPADSNVMLWSSTPGIGAAATVYGMSCGWLNPSYTENPTM